MVQKWILSLAVSFFMRQLARWQDEIDWALVKEDLDTRIRALVPGEWFDQTAVDVIHTLVDVAASVLSATETLRAVIDLLANKDFQGAWTTLRQLILDSWQPAGESEQVMYAYVAELETIA